MRSRDTFRLSQIVEVRSLQQSALEAGLGSAQRACDHQRETVAAAEDALARDHETWLASVSGVAYQLDASTLWAKAVCESAAGLRDAEIGMRAAHERRQTARSDLKLSIGRHDAARTTLVQARRAERRRRDEVAVDIAEDLRRARTGRRP